MRKYPILQLKNHLKKTPLVTTLTLFLCTAGLTSLGALGCDSGSGSGSGSGGENGSTDGGNGSGEDGGEGGSSADAAPMDPALLNWCQAPSANFGFFVTSIEAIWAIAGDTLDFTDLKGKGLGGNFGGIAGADTICQRIATAAGSRGKIWHAFLSATDDGAGNPVHAIERIGTGPWTDANGRTIASNINGLLGRSRPDGDPQSVDDLPNECGIGIKMADGLGDSHDVVTGSDQNGRLATPNNLEGTCNDWTADTGAVGANGGLGPVMAGHSFPRNGNTGIGAHWISDHGLRGCDKGANVNNEGGGGPGRGTCIGCTGGYGAIYCFSTN